MQKRMPSCLLISALVAVLLCANSASAGPSEKTLYSFAGGGAGSYPYGTMIFDNTGNLYGLAGAGGVNGGPAVFKLTPSGSGSWTESLIYSFSNYPGPNLFFDSAGNLYGTFASTEGYGCGEVYQLAASSDGGWTENTIFGFSDSTTDGCYPTSLTIDPATGKLYGTTQGGGSSNGGVVFELTPTEGGGWTFAAIYSFESNSSQDGIDPIGTLSVDSSGNLYGTTNQGGTYENGTVFKLTNGAGGWTEAILYNFTGGDNGSQPSAGVALDRYGNLYGTTDQGGADNVGNVFRLRPTKGVWVMTVIHTFTGGPDGGYPSSSNLTIDSAGNVYGTTGTGGLYNYGTAFKLTPPSSGNRWKETVFHSFTNGADGGTPGCGLVLDSSRNLYGTTNYGGADGVGVVFEIQAN
jgi:uncharacterized repeat protein (TIGR03803 family)